MNRITFFTKPECALCDGALFVIERVRHTDPFALELVDITEAGNEQWNEAYRHDIPVVHLNGVEVFRHHVDERRLRALLRREQDAYSV